MSDVLTLLKNDHQAVESLLGRFDDLPPGDRDGYFCEVVHTLVGHEVAEEMVVYPPVREQGANGAEVADARLGEQAEAGNCSPRWNPKRPIWALSPPSSRSCATRY